MAKDLNYEFTKKNWPNFKAFIEDLAVKLTFDIKAHCNPPLNHAPRPGKEHHRLVKRRDGLSKVCIECKAKGIKQKVSAYNCIICDLPIHVKSLQDHQQRMLRMYFPNAKCATDHPFFFSSSKSMNFIHLPSFLMRPRRNFSVLVPSPSTHRGEDVFIVLYDFSCDKISKKNL